MRSNTVFRAARVLTGGAFPPGRGRCARRSRRAHRSPRDGIGCRCLRRPAGRRGAAAGLVDTHVHVDEPGRAEWEGFESATRAAAAGGVTTIVDMPLNSIPPTVSVAALDEKRAVAEGRVFVDVGFWGGVIPRNLGDLARSRRRECSASSASAPSGVDEFPAVTSGEIGRGDVGHRIARVTADRPRRGYRTITSAPSSRRPRVRRLPGLASWCGGRHRDRRCHPSRRGDEPVPTSCV